MSRKVKCLQFLIKVSPKFGFVLAMAYLPFAFIAMADSSDKLIPSAFIIGAIVLLLVFIPEALELSEWYHKLEIEDYLKRLPSVQRKVINQLKQNSIMAETFEIANGGNPNDVTIIMDLSPIQRLRSQYLTLD